MNIGSRDPTTEEEDRIKAVYGERQDGNRYSYFNPGYLFLIHGLEKRLLFLLSRYGCEPLGTRKILEIGCGTGHWIREFIKWGARPENLAGIDLLASPIGAARHLCPDAVTVQQGSAANLKFPDASFDLVVQFTVFTSVLDPGMKQQIASEMVRVLKPDGFILWYDFFINNPWNPDVLGVKKREIYRLFPGCGFHLERISLAPPVVRLLAPYSWLACYLLERIPWLRTHYLGVIRKV